MIEVLVTGGIACSFCALWIRGIKQNKVFNQHVSEMDNMLDDFIQINEIEWMDYELHPTSDSTKIKKKYIDTSIVQQIGKEIETGYDLFHIKVDAGYNTLLHRHKFSNEFFYVLSGKIAISCTDEDPVYLSKGEYIYIKNKEFHCVTADESSDFIVIAKPPVIVEK